MPSEAQQQAASSDGRGSHSVAAAAAAAQGSGGGDIGSGSSSPACIAHAAHGVSIKLEDGKTCDGAAQHLPEAQDDWEAFMNWDKESSTPSDPPPHSCGLDNRHDSAPDIALLAGSQGSGDTPFGAGLGEWR